MEGKSRIQFIRLAAASGILLLAGLACARSDGPLQTWRLVDPWVGEAPGVPPTATATPTPHPLAYLLPPTRTASQAYVTPTPDAVREPPAPRVEPEIYVVQAGDSLNQIAARFGVGPEQIRSANILYNPDFLSPGQVLTIPVPLPRSAGPGFKIIPDSELVNSPGSLFYDMEGDVARWDGALAHYFEVVEGRSLSGAEVVRLVAQRYSVNPRLLIALLEYQGGWLTQQSVRPELSLYPLGFFNNRWEGLFGQLSWAADQLNEGFYSWQAGWAGPYLFNDGTAINPGPGLNAGTAGVQHLFSRLYPPNIWRDVMSEDGFFQVYTILFGIPFDWAIIPLVPADLEQPDLVLPFETGRSWSFTGGPHSAFGGGSAWAALDFAPPGEPLGCVLSYDWVTSVSDGLVIRSDMGEVIVDLDGDGYEQTGWAILYLHVDAWERVEVGTLLETGDRIGHPSCEGGVSTGTHLHIARKYNGVWISADRDVPFLMDGWVSAGSRFEYDGFLSRGGTVLEACGCRAANNQIWR